LGKKLAAGANVRNNYLSVEDVCITKAFTNASTDFITTKRQSSTGRKIMTGRPEAGIV
jgi:hypothetical protein